MASTYSPNLRLELIGTGEQQGTWGVTTNTNLGTLLEDAIGGYISVAVSDAGDTTLTTSNGSADQARNMVLNLTGTLTATRNVICPAIEKVYIIKNATTGSQSVVFKVSGQTGVTIPNGATVIIYVDGVDARQVTGSMASQNASNVAITGGTISGLSNLSVANATVATTVRGNLGIGTIATQNSNAVSITGGSITGITDLAIADGGTGASDAATARTNLGLGTLATQNGTFSGTSSGTNTGDQSIFQNIAVAGQTTVTADTTSDTLTLVAGTGITITTNATSDTITITGSASGATGTIVTQTFSAPGTWTATSPGLKAVKVHVVGGGGGAGGGNTAPAPLGGTPRLGGGGGAGGGGWATFPVAANPALASPVAVTSGAAGSGVTSGTGGSGGTSSFGALISATGGSGGVTAPTSANGANGGGGTVTSANVGYTGMSGQQASMTSATYLTRGQLNGSSQNAPTYGGGGSGGASAADTGGSGASGIVIVEEFY